MSITRASCCKVNLFLNVLRRRPDGFHEIETVFYPVPLFDYLTIEKRGVGINLTCNNPSLPVDSQNLVYKAAEAFLKKLGTNEGVEIFLDKRLPIAAGIGGGSSNAANTLLGLNELFGFPLDAETIFNLAASLGSDVPFFLDSQPAIATGRGEKLQRLPQLSSIKGAYILLIHPGFGVSTKWAYSELSKFHEVYSDKSKSVASFVELLQTKTIEEAAPYFYNVLEKPVFRKYPILEIYKEFNNENGAVVSLMSGSGSTVFAILKSKDDTENLIEKFQNKFGLSNWIAIAQL